MRLLSSVVIYYYYYSHTILRLCADLAMNARRFSFSPFPLHSLFAVTEKGRKTVSEERHRRSAHTSIPSLSSHFLRSKAKHNTTISIKTNPCSSSHSSISDLERGLNFNRMKNIAGCYSEHAMKISDSYCSRPSNRAYTSSHLAPSTQNSATCVYRVKLSTTGKRFLIWITWSNLIQEKGFCVGICEFPGSYSKFTKNYRILRKQRGAKTFDSGGFRMEVWWDLTRAEFRYGPEPVARFYITIAVNGELSLILGDIEQESEVKKRDSETRVPEFSLISRSEHFSGNAIYSTRAKFCDTGPWHDILIKCCVEDQSPGLSVFVDRKNVIQVKRLQWNFRGNQTIFLDGLVVDMMWDVHDWFFNPTSGYAVFLFRTRSGLDSRLWLEEKSSEQKEPEKIGFCLLISACKNPG